MKINPGHPAYPVPTSQNALCGLTIRAEIASRIMAGLAANHERAGFSGRINAETAVEWADALIAELNKEAPACGS